MSYLWYSPKLNRIRIFPVGICYECGCENCPMNLIDDIGLDEPLFFTFYYIGEL